MTEPIGVVLAGGLGRRIGGSKAMVALCGEPLISYPVRALGGALAEVVILAKPDTELPSLEGVQVWIESPATRHPVVGLVEALSLAEGRPVVVCAVDLPFVTVEVVRSLVSFDRRGAPAVIATCGEVVQPLLGCYQQRALEPLARAAADGSLRAAVEAIGPRHLDVEDPEVLFNVNAPEDLLRAAAIFKRRQGP